MQSPRIAVQGLGLGFWIAGFFLFLVGLRPPVAGSADTVWFESGGLRPGQPVPALTADATPDERFRVATVRLLGLGLPLNRKRAEAELVAAALAGSADAAALLASIDTQLLAGVDKSSWTEVWLEVAARKRQGKEAKLPGFLTRRQGRIEPNPQKVAALLGKAPADSAVALYNRAETSALGMEKARPLLEQAAALQLPEARYKLLQDAEVLGVENADSVRAQMRVLAADGNLWAQLECSFSKADPSEALSEVRTDWEMLRRTAAVLPEAQQALARALLERGDPQSETEALEILGSLSDAGWLDWWIEHANLSIEKAAPEDSLEKVRDRLVMLTRFGSEEAWLVQGKYYLRGQPSNDQRLLALDCFTKVAHSEPMAYHVLARAAREGWVEAPDEAKARQLLLEGSAAGEKSCTYELALSYLREGKTEPAINYLQMASSEGYGPACFKLATIYNTPGTSQYNPKAAVRLAMEGWRLGSENALLLWCDMLLQYRSLRKASVPAELIRVLEQRRGQALDSETSQRYTGVLIEFYTQFGPNLNPVKAWSLLRSIPEPRPARWQALEGFWVLNGFGQRANPQAAVALFEQAHTDPYARALLAECLALGEGVDPDPSRALALFQEVSADVAWVKPWLDQAQGDAAKLPAAIDPPLELGPDAVTLEVAREALSPEARQEPVVLFMPALRYPLPQRRMGGEASGQVRCMVMDDGRAAQLELVSFVGADAFAQRAVESVAAAVFAPALDEGGRPTMRPHTVKLQFKARPAWYQQPPVFRGSAAAADE